MFEKGAYFCIFLFFLSVECRKIRLGSNNRGNSGARLSAGNQPGGGGYRPAGGFQPGGGIYPNQGGGFHPQPAGGYRPQPAGGFHQPAGFQANQALGPSKFNSGTGLGSMSRGSQFKTAFAGGLLGAASGLLIYEAGKAIIHSATTPVNINNRPYYFDEENYQKKNGYFMCSMPLQNLINQTQISTVAPGGDNSLASTTPSPDQLLANIQFKDGTRPKTIVWSCKSGSEVCCGTECCPASVPLFNSNNNNNQPSYRPAISTILFGILVTILLLMCCCCCLAYIFCRSVFSYCFPSSNAQTDASVVYSDTKTDQFQNYGGGYPQQQQPTYPMQPYNSYSQMPQGYMYPSQPPQNY